MLIRRALKEDLPALAEIELEHPSYPAWGVKGLLAEFSNPNAVNLSIIGIGGNGVMISKISPG